MRDAPVSRRRALAWGAGAVAVGVAGALAVEGRTGRERPAVTTTTEAPPPSWDALARRLTGRLVRRSTPGYGLDRLVYNARFTDLHPQGIAYCATPADVALCVEFAAGQGIALAARSGGHSYGAYSSCDGLVVDVSAMSSVALDPVARTAVVGAGARLIDVYESLGRRGWLVPAGSCPTVGVAGLALGGGIGVLARRYGLTCDHLRAATTVTADARVVRADGSTDADLLWASQGGGGGNFGVATSLTFAVEPLPDLAVVTLQFPWAAAADVVDAWQRWVGDAPDELWSNLHLYSQGTAGFLVEVGGVVCASAAEAGTLVDRLVGAVGSAPTYRSVVGDEYLRTMAVEAGCATLSLAACHLASPGTPGRLGRQAFDARSNFVVGVMDPSRIAALVGAVEELAAAAPTLGGALAFDALGGAVARVPAAATAFAHRDALACLQASYSWTALSPATEVAAGAAWLAGLDRAAFDPSAGAYVNYIDPTLQDYASAYYATNLARLSSVRRAYDPDGLFAFAQSVPEAP